MAGPAAGLVSAENDPEPPIGCQFCCDARQTSSPNVMAFGSPESLGRTGSSMRRRERRGSRLAARGARAGGDGTFPLSLLGRADTEVSDPVVAQSS